MTNAKAFQQAAENRFMNATTPHDIDDTVRIRRPARVTTDQHGNTTWMGEVEPRLFELVADQKNTDPYDSAASCSNRQ